MTHSLRLASHSTSVILLGIPGLENYQFWAAFPFCVMYVVAVTGNIIILYIIQIDHVLPGPMYLFLAMLATTDLILSSSTQHKMLAILWFHDHENEYNACLIQVFFTHAFSSVESGVVMALTLCCYVTICFPLMFSWMPICLSHIVSYTYYEQVTMLIQICNILDHDPFLMAFSVVIFDIVNMTIGVTQVVLKLETLYLVFSTDSCSYTNMLCSKLPPPITLASALSEWLLSFCCL
ncbi:olfactory receptor 52R1-like [Rattus norvegicus]|uniref:olfactory receptor 52R1-like n=1 Tax=Rattus norvegicus TaxID=10116 RepID=UPI0002687DF1|nr:olfactory receptor 52R1-like [Rattus norvegicus]|eukprot:XP_008758063.1 PREDICTED: olfactory receptor 52R1-like [Rattus norvegicus]